eukprot:m.311926 g.311926  ORF g.311926 m.311926 type:complete len:60 (+) comp175013_c0_seq1:384-563(+)
MISSLINCGNGIRELPEYCDNGNGNNDGCDKSCKTEICFTVTTLSANCQFATTIISTSI